MSDIKGVGPLGQSSVEPSGNVRQNYQREFVGSNADTLPSPMRIADLAAIRNQLSRHADSFVKGVCVFPGTLNDFKKAMNENCHVVEFFPSGTIPRTLYGLEVHEILSHRIVLIGAHEVVLPILNDPVKLELARQKAYPESVTHVQ